MKHEVYVWLILIGLFITILYAVYLVDKVHREIRESKAILECYSGVPLNKYQKKAIDICEASYDDI